LNLYREIEHYRSRYGALDRWLEARPWLRAVGRMLSRYL